MAASRSRVFLVSFFLLILCNFPGSQSRAQLVPALYTFGDSIVDVGNNDFIPFSLLKADFPHNGIDFPDKVPTGRFCNGKNAADFVAEKLGLPPSPPSLSVLWSKHHKSFQTGLNFASGGGGILNGTGQSLGFVIHLTQQLDHYMTIHKSLVQKLGSDGAAKHLSKSLFLIVSGSNDLFGYYDSPDLRKQSTPQQYVDSMIFIMKGQMQRQHAKGARKFVFVGLTKIGCTPIQRMGSKTEECNEDINSWARKYNEGSISMLQELQSELHGMNYLYFDAYTVLQNILQKPAAYGFTEIKAACCGIGNLKAEVPCIPISSYCSNRKNHVFWDIVHPTEATYRILVDIIFDSTSKHVSPINMKQLLAL